MAEKLPSLTSRTLLEHSYLGPRVPKISVETILPGILLNMESDCSFK